VVLSRMALAAVLSAAALGASGCGQRIAPELSPQANATVATFEEDVRATISLDDRLFGPTYGDLLQSLDAVIALARTNPDAAYRPPAGRGSETMRQVLAAAALRLASYEPALAARLVRVLDEVS
jgi:hypothetical protein